MRAPLRYTARVTIAAMFAATTVALPATPGLAAPAPDWTATHESARASGTAQVSTDIFIKRVMVVGELTAGTEAQCYRLQLVVNHDLAVQFIDVADSCDGTPTPFESGASGSRFTSSVAARICRLDGDTLGQCGTSVRLG